MTVVVVGNVEKGSEKPAVLAAAEPICEFRRVRLAELERLSPCAARIAGVTEFSGYKAP